MALVVDFKDSCISELGFYLVMESIDTSIDKVEGQLTRAGKVYPNVQAEGKDALIAIQQMRQEIARYPICGQSLEQHDRQLKWADSGKPIYDYDPNQPLVDKKKPLPTAKPKEKTTAQVSEAAEKPAGGAMGEAKKRIAEAKSKKKGK